MKRFLSIITVVLLATVASSYAQFRVGPYVTTADSVDDFGVGGGLRTTKALTESALLDFRVSYIPYMSFDAFPLELGLFGNHSIGDWEWYGGGGFGYYIYKLDSGALDDPDPVAGYFFAGGTTVPVTEGVRLFLEIKYTSADVHVVSARTPIPGGYRWTEAHRGLDGLGANIGLQWEL